MTNRITLRQLAYFVAAVEAGTLRGAAQRLHVSQSALSEALNQLEKDLGARLMIRQRAQGVTLTNLGRVLIDHARATLQSSETFQAIAGGRDRVLSGTITIGCYTTLAPFIIPPLVASLRISHPSLQVEILEGSADDIQAELLRARCECAFVYNFDLQTGIEHETLYRIRPHVLLPGRHREASRKVVELSRLAEEPFILFDLQPSRRNTQMIFNEAGVTPNISIRSKNFELVRSLVGRGLGYSILIQRPPMSKSYEGNPVAIREIARMSAMFSVTFAYRKQNKHSYRLEAVREICRAHWPTH